jgi:hypothetical protein
LRLIFGNGPARSGAVFFVGLCALSASIADARELTIEASPCAERIRIHAREVPLQEVVSGLSAAMGVRLVAQVQLQEPVSFDVSGTPEDVLKRILHGKNLVTETKAVAACGSRDVLATIWLLPVGQEAARPRTDQPRIERAGEQPEFRSHESNQGKRRPSRKAGQPRAQEDEDTAATSEPPPER